MNKNPQRFLAYGRQDIDESDISAVADVLRGDWLTTGPSVEKFETVVAERVGARHAVACSSGTAALHLAVLGAGVGMGDVAIVPAVTFQATASAVLLAGGDVVLADVDPDTALMRPEDLEEALERARKTFPKARISAVLPVHMAGRPADMAGIGAVAGREGLAVIEDAAHAIGTVGASGPVGGCQHADSTIFSFHPVKTVTSGEGGMVVTNDETQAARMRCLCSHGIQRDASQFSDKDAGLDGDAPNPWYYEIDEIGFNYRITDIHAALGASQMARLDDFISHRQAIHAIYVEQLGGVKGVSCPTSDGTDSVAWHLAVALIDFDRFGRTRAQVMGDLSDAGVGTQVHYMPLYRHAYFKKRYGDIVLPGAEAYYARTLSLPLHPGIGSDDAVRVVSALKEALGV